MMDASHKQLLVTLKNTFSDRTVTCGSDSYKVHKNIVVCSRTEFFARAMRFGGKEATEGIVDLPGDNPATVKRLCQWIYEDDYASNADKIAGLFPCPTQPSDQGEENLLIQAKMYEIADKYDVADLKDLVKEKFHWACTVSWNASTLSNAAHHVFSTTPEHEIGLRDTVISTIHRTPLEGTREEAGD
ncbi:hypothetical protein G6011_02794 [Alternaria panax]|uniref:BTB domain-containing protein n=1 Tax=Alternaria panax TaxID=48097 RepID=A0AAD4I589_9PLEO|nr:hypothetical protein G6011_02794 [Alternaria panax]